MNKDYDILCIGLIVADLLVKPVSSKVFDVDTTLVDQIDLTNGGDALNESIILSRLGNKVGLAGKVGCDAFGDMLVKTALKNNINVDNIKIDSNSRTGMCIVLVNENGDRNFVVQRGANATLSVNDIDLSIIKHAKIVNIGSVLSLKLLDKDGVVAIFKEARLNNVMTTADITHDSYKIGFSGIKEMLAYTDIAFPSYGDAAYLTNETEPEKIADVFLNAGVQTIVIKLGEKGCYIKSLKESYLIDSYKTEVLDTTGAGDNFVAGFLTGVLKGWDLKKCGIFANAVGALCVQKVGATASVQSLDQVLDYINSFNAAKECLICR